MKVSIWRQFSSNNSTDYVMVGEFQRVGHAKQAHTLLVQMLKEIAGWYRTQKTRPNAVWDNQLTPIEHLYQSRFGWQWHTGIDWMGLDDDRIEQYSEQVDHLLIMRTVNTSITSTPEGSVGQLIEHFDGVPRMVEAWRVHYQTIIEMETRTEQDAGILSRQVVDGSITLPDSRTVNASLQRKRQHLTFIVTDYYGLADLIRYLKTFKPKALAYSFEKVENR